jgi:DNA-binding XRE family transcriptional regulator
MDKRRKHIDREAEHALRQQFYERIQRGDISVAEAVKSMRRISLLTQAEFAKHRGVSLRVLKEIEAGTANPTLETLNRIGAIFGLRVGFVATPKNLPERPD